MILIHDETGHIYEITTTGQIAVRPLGFRMEPRPKKKRRRKGDDATTLSRYRFGEE